MPPAFPGMNPYLENPELWSEVHFGLISALARSLNSILIPKYRAAVEKRVYADLLFVGIPDVTVFSTRPAGGSVPVPTSVAAVQQPVRVTPPMPGEVREHFLEIRQVSSGQVITRLGLAANPNGGR